MNRGLVFFFSLCTAFFVLPARGYAACTSIVNLKTVSSSARGGTVIWKSNWDRARGREQSFAQGNHSQKGGALLVVYRSNLVPSSSVINVYNSKGTKIAQMGRYPRCTNLGCGQHERWYLRAPGGSQTNIASLSQKAGGAVLIQLRGNSCAKVSNVLDNREQF